ncbi:hypothetical protein ACJD0Z_12885 [Flavobacteriaceae bacterium M23B6Z8]
MVNQMVGETESIWNSLEVVKVIVSIATPLIGGIIAYRLSKIGKDLEKKQWAGRKIIEKRLEFYDRVVPDLNDLYCYYHRFGNWKELLPTEIILKKRNLDKEFHIYSHLFKKNIINKYQIFIHNCFKTYTGWGNDAKLKMNLVKRQGLEGWKSEWDDLFVPDEQVEPESFKKSYDQLLYVIKRELEI